MAQERSVLRERNAELCLAMCCPDRSQVLTRTTRHVLSMWDVWSGEKVWTHGVEPGYVMCFSTNGDTILLLDIERHQLYERDTCTGLVRRVVRFRGANSLKHCTLSSHVDRAYLQTRDGKAGVWDLFTGEMALHLGHRGERTYGRFSNDDSLLILTGAHMPPEIWDLSAGAIRCRLMEYRARHTYNSPSVLISDDNALVATYECVTPFEFWDAETGASFPKRVSHGVQLGYTSDAALLQAQGEELLAIAAQEHGVAVWRLSRTLL
jgi:WD40 repeat protein